MTEIDVLVQMIRSSQSIVVFSGAGLSTNSGIPDFRSADGIYNQKLKSKILPEEIISHSFFIKYPKDFYSFYFSKMVYPEAKPNEAHLFFADLEKMGKKVTVVTQNIDNLHQMAGSTNVIELHGSVMRNYCMKCGKYYDLKDISTSNVPYCDCGGIIKPDVVLYEEGLKQRDIERAIESIENCDMLIVVGTSLVVYPAASFIRFYQKNKLVLLNKSETPYDSMADLVIHDDIKKIVEEIKRNKL